MKGVYIVIVIGCRNEIQKAYVVLQKNAYLGIGLSVGKSNYT